ncbi:MAG: TIGR04255 family protein [Gemmataceae bacterium]|nr:TIGR04255 family protein [Gemmataceae bacterium]
MEPRASYSKPPIREALIEVQVTLPASVTTDTLVQMGQEETYPTQGKLYFQQAVLVAGAGVSPEPGPSLIGHSFQSRDGKQIVHARLNGFLFSRLQPYEGWEPFRNEARRLWEVYRAVTRPEAITRVAVRYVNQLDIPLTDADLREYVRLLPALPVGLSAPVSHFFMEVQIPQEDLQGMLILREATLTPASPGLASVLLDIDLFRTTELPQEERSLWDFVERLRTRKNHVFEECITDRTRELIR